MSYSRQYSYIQTALVWPPVSDEQLSYEFNLPYKRPMASQGTETRSPSHIVIYILISSEPSPPVPEPLSRRARA
jgi:hypothetical protein